MSSEELTLCSHVNCMGNSWYIDDRPGGVNLTDWWFDKVGSAFICS
jgi:hypothetical protein